ncbi:MAG: apolipoprotein N-acyltransferase [Minicystis sp.]
MTASQTGSARRRLALGSVLASAAMLALYSRVEAPWFVLGLVAFVPWILAIDRAASIREAAALGAVMSAAFVAAVFPWFPAAAQRYTQGSPVLLWIVLIVAAPILEPQLVVFAVVRHVVRRAPGPRPALRAAIAGAFAYVAAELLVPKLFFDTLGLGLHPARTLRQAADLAGVHGLTWMLILCNEAVCAALTGARSASPRRRFAPLAGAMVMLLAAAGYGHLRAAQIEARSTGPGHVVGIVQANITNYDKLRAEKGAFETVRFVLESHVSLSDALRERAGADVIIWPETVYPTTFGAPRSEAGAELDAQIAASAGVPLVFGAFEAEGDREYNAAFFLDAGTGWPRAFTAYRKRMLFPLTEWVPETIDSESLRRTLPWLGHWTRGPGPKVVPLALRGGERVSVLPLICYDVLFPDLVGEGAALGADWIITLSNDAWFPDARAPRLHLISAAFRSIETRLPQARATNSGISAIISPTGDITARTGWDERAALAGRMTTAGRTITLAVAIGPWRAPLAALATLLIVLDAIRRGLRPGDGPARTRESARNKRAG